MTPVGSAFGQDRFVLEMLGGMRGGYFLDSGASDGLHGSNSWLLETAFGWSGICVEPNPVFFAELRANRRCVCENCCLYTRGGTVGFIEAGVLGGIAKHLPSAIREQARRTGLLDTTRSGRPKVVKRPARTIRSILDEHHAPRVIDYWSLDTEGSELALLESFPFDSYAVRVLTVEHNFFPARDAIRALLEGAGYVRVRELCVDDAYVRRSDLPVRGWRSRAWRR